MESGTRWVSLLPDADLFVVLGITSFGIIVSPEIMVLK